MLAISITAPMALAKKDDNPGKQLGKTKEKKVKTQEGEQVAETEEFGKTYTPAADNGLNKGKSPVEHLYLYEKDPETWEIVEDGAWAKVTILTHKDKFIFNGHNLPVPEEGQPYTDYSLINYAQVTVWEDGDGNLIPEDEMATNPWDESDYFIGSGTVNEEGNVHIKGEWSDAIQGKVWLVLSDDYNGLDNLDNWNPDQYLFEYDLLRPYITEAH